MGIYRVHNLKEGGRSGNWLEYWKRATGKNAYLCHKVDCYQLATDGAHVQLDLLMTTDGISYHFAIDVTANLVSILWLKDRWYL